MIQIACFNSTSYYVVSTQATCSSSKWHTWWVNPSLFSRSGSQCVSV